MTFARFEYVISSLWLLAMFAVYLDHRRRVMKVKRLNEPDLGSKCLFGGRVYRITSIGLTAKNLSFDLQEEPGAYDSVL